VAQLGTADAAVLGEADAAVLREMTRLDLAGCRGDKLAELLALLISDRGPKVLNFGNPLADEGDDSDVGDPTDPGIADSASP
jgi:hypothetical protein